MPSDIASSVTGPEFWADAVSNIQHFADRHANNPEAAETVAAFRGAVVELVTKAAAT